MKISIREAQENESPSVYVPEGFERKLIKNSDGIIIEVFKKEDWRVLIYANYVLNGKMYVPRVILKVLKGNNAEAIVSHSVFMSKREMQEAGIDKTTPKDIKMEKFRQYVKKHKDKYRHQIISSIKESEKDISEREKFKINNEQGIITTNVYDQLKEFIDNPSDSNKELLMQDIKDKGYIL